MLPRARVAARASTCPAAPASAVPGRRPWRFRRRRRSRPRRPPRAAGRRLPALPEVPETPPAPAVPLLPAPPAVAPVPAAPAVPDASPVPAPASRRAARAAAPAAGCIAATSRSAGPAGRNRSTAARGRRPAASARESCHLSRRSQRSQSSHLCRHRLSPSPSIRQQRKARPTAKTGPFFLRPYAARRGLLWSRDSPSDRVAVSNYRSMSLRATFLRSRPVAPTHGMFLATSAAYRNVGHQLCAGRVRVNPVARVLRIWKVARLRQRGPDVDHIDRRRRRRLASGPGWNHRIQGLDVRFASRAAARMHRRDLRDEEDDAGIWLRN